MLHYNIKKCFACHLSMILWDFLKKVPVTPKLIFSLLNVCYLNNFAKKILRLVKLKSKNFRTTLWIIWSIRGRRVGESGSSTICDVTRLKKKTFLIAHLNWVHQPTNTLKNPGQKWMLWWFIFVITFSYDYNTIRHYSINTADFI